MWIVDATAHKKRNPPIAKLWSNKISYITAPAIVTASVYCKLIPLISGSCCIVNQAVAITFMDLESSSSGRSRLGKERIPYPFHSFHSTFGKWLSYFRNFSPDFLWADENWCFSWILLSVDALLMNIWKIKHILNPIEYYY